MKKFKLVIGIDISKSKLDVCIIEDPNSKQHNYFITVNNRVGIASIVKEARRYKIDMSECLFCFENTGVYSMHLCTELEAKKYPYAMVPAIEIKRSKGLVRGKSDKTDSRDIALYGITHSHKINLTNLPEADLMKLKLLLTEREKLMKALSAFYTTNENNGYIDKAILKEVLSSNKKTISFLKKQLTALEKTIQSIIHSNEKIKAQFELAKSVPGVGTQTAINLIVTTRCFSAFKNWRKLACYAGIAPFEYTSGTSIRGKTKVSPMGNKKLKTLLNMAALTAIKTDKQLKDYYERKKKEGKNGMLILNSIRCKIISRVFATINREKPYVDFLKYSA